MKSMLKRALRALGRRLKPFIRPLVRKVDNRISGLIEATVRPLIVAENERRIRPALDDTAAIVRAHIDRNEDVITYLRHTTRENTLLLDSLVRELIRVQTQLESLQQLVEDQEQSSDRSSRHVASDRFDTIGTGNARMS
jgi:hypothetical protein